MLPHARIRASEADKVAVLAVLESGHWADGTEVARLEESLSRLCDGAHAVAVSSGTAALYLALDAVGVSPGDEVVIPSYACNSLYAAVSHAGGRAVCADTGSRTVTLTPDTVRAVAGSSTRAVIAPHTFGYLADITSIGAIGPAIIEDCAQAIGGKYPDGAPVGTKGQVGVFSFHATKMLPSGAGGACVTRDAALANRIRRLRYCDERPIDARAFNFRLNDLCAAIARVRIPLLPSWIAERARIADMYDRHLSPWSFARNNSIRQAVCYRYIVKVNGNMERFLAEASTAGITCRKPVWRPLHHALDGHCPRTNELWETTASIPMYPGLEDEEIEHVCKTLPSLLSAANLPS
jgi:dTDP-4-amino-4,6-dideoxygalactose transaminase